MKEEEEEAVAPDQQGAASPSHAVSPSSKKVVYSFYRGETDRAAAGGTLDTSDDGTAPGTAVSYEAVEFQKKEADSSSGKKVAMKINNSKTQSLPLNRTDESGQDTVKPSAKLNESSVNNNTEPADHDVYAAVPGGVNLSMSKEDAINQLLILCSQKGIDVPESVRNTLTSADQMAGTPVASDAASTLTFALSKIADDDASIAESVSTLVTNSGLNTISGDVSSAPSVSSTNSSTGYNTGYIQACQKESPARVDNAMDTSFVSTATNSTSMSRRGRGIMLADNSNARAVQPVKVDPVPPLCESPVASSQSNKPATPLQDIRHKPDEISRTPQSFGSTVDTSFSSGRGSPLKTPLKKEVSKVGASGSGGAFYPDEFEDNGPKSKSRLLSAQRIKLLLALILVIGGLVGIIVGVLQAVQAKGGGSSSTASSNAGEPTPAPTGYRLEPITAKPTRAPKKKKNKNGKQPITAPTTQAPTTVDDIADPDLYIPGHLTEMKLGVRLSNGLDIDVIATSKSPVKFSNGKSSELKFHERPDYGATFPIPNTATTNKGGWVYLSNSEIEKEMTGDKVISGGVGMITFSRYGKAMEYKMLLNRTDRNCGGGTTPWSTFISCEESRKNPPTGHCYQVDPFAIGEVKKGQMRTVLGGLTGGSFESFAHDVRNEEKPRFFVTEDQLKGALRRFTPSVVDWENPARMLHDETGVLEYLLLEPDENARRGNFTWITNKDRAGRSAAQYYPNSEGIDVANGILYFVSKKDEDLFILDLDNRTYERKIVKEEGIDVSPDQLIRLGGDDGILYLTEDGGEHAGVHGRDAQGRYFTILESPIYKEETTGLAFSPNKKHMYLAYQKNGILLDVWRKDGKKFDGTVLNTKYHKSP